MTMLQEKLDFLLNKYSVKSKAVLENEDTVLIDGVKLPIRRWRSERRFTELKSIACGGTLEGISVMRVARIVPRNSDIYKALYRELDICQFVLERKIASIMVMQNDFVLNAIATTEDKVVCTIEISSTLNPDEAPKDKHEIIAKRGTACDIVVDAQLKQDLIYVFGNENKKYTDVDFELFGLLPEDISIVRAAFSIANGQRAEQVKDENENLERLVELALKSAKSGQREEL